MPALPPTVRRLGLVSLLTDASSEMIYPLLPSFLTGVLGAPRDALLAQVTPREDLGRAYGFHRAMDHAGAVVGPLIASALLLLHLDLRTVFALAALPALASVLVLVFAVQEAPPPTAVESPTAPPKAEETPGTKPAPRGLGRLLAVIGLFTLGNSSDAFLL